MHKLKTITFIAVISLALIGCGGGGGSSSGGGSGSSSSSPTPVTPSVMTITGVELIVNTDEAVTGVGTGYDNDGSTLSTLADEDSTVDTDTEIIWDADGTDLPTDPGGDSGEELNMDVELTDGDSNSTIVEVIVATEL